MTLFVYIVMASSVIACFFASAILGLIPKRDEQA